MTIAEVSARYDAACDVTVELHALDWPAMRETVGILRELRRASDAGVSRTLEELLDDAGVWHRTLMGSTIPPDASELGTRELAARLGEHYRSEIDTHLRRPLARIIKLLDALADEPHPAAACLEGVLSRYGRREATDPPAVYVAARQDDDAARLRRWLADEELDAEVCRVSALRDAPVRDALVLLGPPARYSVSGWCPLPRAELLSAWLVSAPPARDVHVVTWPGHPGFNAATTVAFPGSSPPPIHVATRPQGPAVVAEATWLAPAAVIPEARIATSWQYDRDPVEARGFRLTGDGAAFFSADSEPRPQVVTWELAGADIRSIDVSKVRIGQALMFRPERATTDEKLHRRADQILVERHGPAAPEAAKAAKAALKRALAATPKSYDRLVYELTSRLNNDGYARHVLHALPRPDYIAPERAGAYPAVRQVLGMPPDPDGRDYALLAALRAACRRAGGDVTRELVEVLRTTSGWQTHMEMSGAASITAGDGVGHLEVRVVVAVDPELRRLGRNRLGRLLALAPAADGVVATDHWKEHP